jgi:hypothetical protein
VNDALRAALELYAETRNRLVQREKDLEALWNVVAAADNLAQIIRHEEESRELASLTKHLDDRQEGDGDFAKSVEVFIARNMPEPNNRVRNEMIRLVAQHLPELTQRELAIVCGQTKSTVNRVLMGEDTGGPNRGHGGARI